MQAGTRRRIAAAFAALALASAMTAASAQARLTAPGTAAAKSCTTQLAGYVPTAGWGDGTDGWVWDGRHRVRLCVYRGTGGWMWGSARLDGPYDQGNGTHDRFTGGWTVQLQGCTSSGLVTMATAYDAWDGAEHPVYDVAGVADSRWIWSEVFTNNKPPGYASYRVWARSAGAAIPSRLAWGWSYALSANGMSGMESWYGPCVRV